MTKLRIQRVILFALVGLGLGAPSIHADADVDCHSLSKWDKSKTYQKGELVWEQNRDPYSHGSEYKCAPSSSWCGGEPKSGADWKLVGNCKMGTEPN
jgi:hypothetical protein